MRGPTGCQRARYRLTDSLQTPRPSVVGILRARPKPILLGVRAAHRHSVIGLGLDIRGDEVLVGVRVAALGRSLGVGCGVRPSDRLALVVGLRAGFLVGLEPRNGRCCRDGGAAAWLTGPAAS